MNAERFICLNCRITFDYAPRWEQDNPFCPRCAQSCPREADVLASLDQMMREFQRDRAARQTPEETR